jgi:hypothetical protein
VIAGAAVGLVLLSRWRDPLPGRRPLAAVVAMGGLVGVGYATFAAVRAHASHERVAAVLMPANELPTTLEQARSRADELIDKYPRDPRPRLDRAGGLLLAADLEGAERDLRAGLADAEVLAVFDSALATRLRATLALVLLAQSRPDEAAAMAGPACGNPGPLREQFELFKRDLCGAGGGRLRGPIEPARIAAAAKAAEDFVALARQNRRPPHQSDPAAAPLLDAVLDLHEIPLDPPLLLSQSFQLAKWQQAINQVWEVLPHGLLESGPKADDAQRTPQTGRNMVRLR